LHRWLRDEDQVDALIHQQTKLWTEHGIELSHAAAMLDRAWVLAQRGNPEQAIDPYKRGLTTWLSVGMTNHLTEFWAVLTEIYARAGQVQQALDLLEQTIDRIEETGERYHEAEVYRLRGEIRLQSDPDDVEGAESDLRHALDVAVAQKARMLELRAAMSQYRLWRDRDDAREQEALGRLEAVYGWFTEGFDTRDLQEAKALLDAVGRDG
jgi:predicted ATPase